MTGGKGKTVGILGLERWPDKSISYNTRVFLLLMFMASWFYGLIRNDQQVLNTVSATGSSAQGWYRNGLPDCYLKSYQIPKCSKWSFVCGRWYG